MIWDELPNQVKLSQYGYVEDSMCQLCERAEDGNQHYMECCNEGLKDDRERTMGNLRARMRTDRINPFLAQ